MAQLDKPNLVLPLAASYNERGVDGYATTVTSGKDQRKINSWYEPVGNALTGKRTLYLAKRPGIRESSVSLNSSITTADLIISVGSPDTDANHWVLGRNSGDVVAVNSASSNALETIAGYAPAYVDKTFINSTETVIVQLRASGVTQRVWFASAINSWTRITDGDFPNPLGKMEFMDGFAFAFDNTNKVFNSDVNSLANWTATSYITKTILQDYPRGLAKLGRVLLAFGTETVEGFYNAGNTSGSPLGRIPQISQGIGLSALAANALNGSKHYSTVLSNRLYFIGTSGGQKGDLNTSEALYMFDGSRFEMVSTVAINKLLSGGFIYNVQTVNISGRPFVGISLTNNGSQTQRWLCFYPEWNDWFEWTTSFVQLANNGRFFVGMDPTKLGKLSVTDSWVDGTSTAYTMTHQFKLPSKGNHRKFMPVCGVIGDTQTSASSLTVEFSDDDYQNFSTGRTIDLTTQKKQLYRCGSYRDRAVRLTHSANTDCRLEAFVATVK